MKIGFTGTQFGMSNHQKEQLRIILSVNKGEFHHGDCIGADAEAHDIALDFEWEIVIHPPIDPKKRAFCSGFSKILEPKEYLLRNRDIVNDTEELIVAPLTDVEVIQSGTWSTKRYAQKVGKPFDILSR